MRHLLALHLQLEVGLLLRANINRDTDRFDDLAVLIFQTTPAHDYPANFSVGQEQTVFALEFSMDRALGVIFGFDLGALIGMNSRKDGIASQFRVRLKTVNRPSLLAHPRRAILRIQTPQREIGRFRRQTDARFSLAKHFLLSLSLDRDPRNVCCDIGEAIFFWQWAAFFFTVHCKRTK